MRNFREVFGIAPAEAAVPDKVPSVVAVVHDEALRLPYFLDHHRALGVRRFFIVDDRSSDGTTELLEAMPDVVRIPARGPFRTMKGTWIGAVIDTWLDGRWALVLDADELLVYPGWPHRTLGALVADLEAHGEEAMFASLVDMYGDGNLDALGYRAGEPFLNACPYFDADGYMLAPRSIMRRKAATPDHYIIGGTRQRLFFEKRPPTPFEKRLMRRFFSLHRREPDSPLAALGAWLAWHWLTFSYVKSRPAMSKVPLWRARAGEDVSGGQHHISRPLRQSEEWASLLHFKYLQDFADRVSSAASALQHTKHYKMYRRTMEDNGLAPLFYEGSRRFTDVGSLIEVGLMRERRPVAVGQCRRADVKRHPRR